MRHCRATAEVVRPHEPERAGDAGAGPAAAGARWRRGLLAAGVVSAYPVLRGAAPGYGAPHDSGERCACDGCRLDKEHICWRASAGAWSLGSAGASGGHGATADAVAGGDADTVLTVATVRGWCY